MKTIYVTKPFLVNGEFKKIGESVSVGKDPLSTDVRPEEAEDLIRRDRASEDKPEAKKPAKAPEKTS